MEQILHANTKTTQGNSKEIRQRDKVERSVIVKRV
jgi:hypothetical protein